MEQKCIKCGENKPSKDFYIHDNQTGKLRKTCKQCIKIYSRQVYLTHPERNNTDWYFRYKKDLYVFIYRMYGFMKDRKKGRGSNGHYGYYQNLPLCSKKDFVNFAMRNWQLKYLFTAWQRSGYQNRLLPTPDRITNENGYVLDNIQFLTFNDNRKKRWFDGKRNKYR